MLEDLPTAMFYHLTRTGMEASLALRLLVEDAYLAEMRRLAPAASSATRRG